MTKAKAKAHARINFLDKQIAIQQDALMKASGETMCIHSYLLQKCTDEWCKLVDKYGLPLEGGEEK